MDDSWGWNGEKRKWGWEEETPAGKAGHQPPASWDSGWSFALFWLLQEVSDKHRTKRFCGAAVFLYFFSFLFLLNKLRTRSLTLMSQWLNTNMLNSLQAEIKEVSSLKDHYPDMIILQIEARSLEAADRLASSQAPAHLPTSGRAQISS